MKELPVIYRYLDSISTIDLSKEEAPFIRWIFALILKGELKIKKEGDSSVMKRTTHSSLPLQKGLPAFFLLF